MDSIYSMASADSQRPWMAKVNRRKSSLEAPESVSVANKEDKKGLTDLLFQSYCTVFKFNKNNGFRSATKKANRLLRPAWWSATTVQYSTWYIFNNSRGGGTVHLHRSVYQVCSSTGPTLAIIDANHRSSFPPEVPSCQRVMHIVGEENEGIFPA
jgi:hypothetical protein